MQSRWCDRWNWFTGKRYRCPALQTVDDFIYEATSFDALVARERVILYNILHVRSLIDKNKPDVKDKVDVSEVSADSCHK